MSRIPAFMLTHSVSVEATAGTGPRGATFATAVTRAAHVEERAKLMVDQRATAETAGTMITMTVLVVMQLEHHVEPGSLITWRGKKLTVANAAYLEHRSAPSHSELWCV